MLVAWALALIALLDRTPYGFDEATARAVLDLWSIADQVPSAIITLGVPDARALILAPAGIAFAGSLLAVKCATILVYLAAVIALYRWRTRDGDSEAPRIASGLLLIAPAAVALIDRVDVAPFLLLCLVLGAWCDRAYREAGVRFGGMYFGQLLLCLALPTLHPAGLAFAALLAASWLRRPPSDESANVIPGRERTHVLAGVAVATIAGVLLAGGWPQQVWLGNPLSALSRGILGFTPQSDAGDAFALFLGVVLLVLTVAVLWWTREQWRGDALGRSLALAWLVCAFCADGSFVLLTLVWLLHWGYPLLLRVRLGKGESFAAQRGLAFVLLTLACTAFLVSDRGRYASLQRAAELSPQDRLLQTLAASVQARQDLAARQARPGQASAEEQARSSPRVASQWPGRTMLACRCSVLPLPPAGDDAARFTANLRGLDFVVFDPREPANLGLARAFAELGGERASTLALQAGGVVLELRGVERPPVPAPQAGGGHPD